MGLEKPLGVETIGALVHQEWSKTEPEGGPPVSLGGPARPRVGTTPLIGFSNLKQQLCLMLGIGAGPAHSQGNTLFSALARRAHGLELKGKVGLGTGLLNGP